MPKHPDRMELAVKEYIKGVYIERKPKYTWATAMLAAGYSENYINTQGHLCKKRAESRLTTAKDKLFTEQRYNLKDWERKLQELHADCEESKDRTNTKGCLEMGIKLNGGFIDRSINLNADIPQEPAAYKAWLETELERVSGTAEVIESYDKSKPAIAERY